MRRPIFLSLFLLFSFSFSSSLSLSLCHKNRAAVPFAKQQQYTYNTATRCTTHNAAISFCFLSRRVSIVGIVEFLLSISRKILAAPVSRSGAMECKTVRGEISRELRIGFGENFFFPLHLSASLPLPSSFSPIFLSFTLSDRSRYSTRRVIRYFYSGNTSGNV